MKIVDAVKEAHAGKYAILDVKSCNGKYSWDMNEDTGYCNYKKAREHISKHKILEWILCLFKII